MMGVTQMDLLVVALETTRATEFCIC